MTTTTLKPEELHSTAPPAKAAVAKMVPIGLAYVPFAMAVGSAVAADRNPVAAWIGTWTIYGGSAHLAVLQQLRHSSLLLAVVTGLVINARLLAYSSSLANDWSRQPRWFRVLAAAVLIDPSWAAGHDAIDRYASPAHQRRYYLTAAAVVGVCWGTALTVGALLGAHLPSTIDLGISGPVCLIALVGPRLAKRQHRGALIAAASTAIATSWAPSGVPVIAAVVVACVVAARSGEVPA